MLSSEPRLLPRPKVVPETRDSPLSDPPPTLPVSLITDTRMDASLLLDHQPHAATPGTTVVRALLSIAGTAPASACRAPLGLSLVLDRSGSMSGAPLHAARSAAAGAVERLHPDDVVSAVLFDQDIETLA